MNEVIAALLGTLVGGLITWFISNRQNKIQTTFGLLREFHSRDLYQSRTIASKLIGDYPRLTLDELKQKYPEETFHLLQIVIFYQRLQIAVKYHQVKLNLIPELFGEIFIWWYIVCFKEQLLFSGSRFHAKKHIVDLNNWLCKHPKISKDLLNEWVIVASEERERRIVAKSQP